MPTAHGLKRNKCFFAGYIMFSTIKRMQFTFGDLTFLFRFARWKHKIISFFFLSKNSQLYHKFSIKFNYIITSIYYNIIIIKRTLDRIVDSHCQFIFNFGIFLIIVKVETWLKLSWFTRKSCLNFDYVKKIAFTCQ